MYREARAGDLHSSTWNSVDKKGVIMTVKVNDFDLANGAWKDLDHIRTSSWWDLPKAGESHNHEYYGAFIPEIPLQMIERYTIPGDLVFDPFVGSGTTVYAALELGRSVLAIDLSHGAIETIDGRISGEDLNWARTVVADSTEDFDPITRGMKSLGYDEVHLAIFHPPYHNIIEFNPNLNCLSRQPDVGTFLEKFGRTLRFTHSIMTTGRYIAIVIGDIYKDRALVPLSHYVMQTAVDAGFTPKAIIAKNMTGNEKGSAGKNKNLWRYRALSGGFYTFGHEYVQVMYKGA